MVAGIEHGCFGEGFLHSLDRKKNVCKQWLNGTRNIVADMWTDVQGREESYGHRADEKNCKEKKWTIRIA